LPFDILKMKSPNPTYEISIRDNETEENYSNILLSLESDKDCKTIVLASYLDCKSIIAVDRKRYMVIQTYETRNGIIIYVKQD